MLRIRKYSLSLALIFVGSLSTLLLFQNCGGMEISSQSSNSSGLGPSGAENLPPQSIPPDLAALKPLYVDSASGDDSISYAENSFERPWRTILRAARGSTSFSQPIPQEAAQPGDVVFISEGIYWESGDPNGGRFSVALNPINNGTSEAPIVFKGLGKVEVRLLAGFRGGMIGCNSREHIIWDQFFIDDFYGGSTSDTGPAVFSGNSRHCQLVNSEVVGHPGSYFHGYPTFGGNYRGVSLEPAHHTIIRNNRLHNFRGGQNEAAIMAYNSNDNIIENNEIFNSGSGVFIKGVHPGQTQQRNIIRKNLIYGNTSAGIRVLGAEDTFIYQNVLVNNSGVALWAGFFNSSRSRFVNNTLVNNGTGVVPQGADLVDVRFYNNIVVGSTGQAIYNWDLGNPSPQDIHFDRNLYFMNARHANYESTRPVISMENWQSLYRLDVNSLVGDPLFTDANSGDFRLQAGSAALILGRDILGLLGSNPETVIPAGAYITENEVIGRRVSP